LTLPDRSKRKSKSKSKSKRRGAARMKRYRILVGVFLVLLGSVLAGTLLLMAAAVRRHTAPGPEARRHWRPATTAERRAAIASIQAQLDAFRKDDYQQAVSYQSASLKRSFRSVTEFRRMMKRSYPQ